MVERCFLEVSKELRSLNIPHEVIFVDDGSIDGTWKKVEQLSTHNGNCHGIKFSRNFGKEAAIFAGLCKAKGDCCIIMDCDLQHPPSKFNEMISAWKCGYDIVRCIKKSRGKEGVIHRCFAKGFYKLSHWLMGSKVDIRNSSDFQLLDRKVIENILTFKEQSIFFRGISSFVGFSKKNILFDVPERIAGVSKWSYISLMKYAMSNIVAFSTRPLQFVTVIGGLIFFVSCVLSLRTLYVYVCEEAAPGISTVIIFLSFVASLIMISLGIVGYYIGKIYEEVKCRPRYIVAKEV